MLWKVYTAGRGAFVIEKNRRLEISMLSNAAGSYFAAGYTSVGALLGDFDMQVDYKLLNWSSANGVRVGLLSFNRTKVYSVQRNSLGRGEFAGYPIENFSTNFDGNISFVGTSDQSGRLRMVRTGNILVGYQQSIGATDWKVIGRSYATREPLQFQIKAWSHDAYFADQNSKVAFDNFVITTGQVIPNPRN